MGELTIDKLSFKREIPTGKFEKRGVFMSAARDLCSEFFTSMEYIWLPDGNIAKRTIRISCSAEAFDVLVDRYVKIFSNDYNQLFSHYFRNLYHIFKLIFNSSLIDNQQKQFYASVVKAQLSSDELFLILYNSLIKNLGYPNFLFLIRELDILESFDFTLIEKFEFHKEIFEEELAKAEPRWPLPKGYVMGSIKNA